MNLIRQTLVSLLTVCILLVFSGCCLHTWREANCTSPKTCIDCGATEGDVSHQWQCNNCTENQFCSICGTVGVPFGHSWIDATCITPKVCGRCFITEGTALGHSTKKGTCSRCDEYVNLLSYNDGFAIVTINDCKWMKDNDNFLDVCVVGTITDISKTNDLKIKDLDGGTWTVAVGTNRDLSSYLNTTCTVFGFSTGGTSSIHHTPLINMTHDDNRIVFFDDKELYPKVDETWEQFEDKYADSTDESDTWVWVSNSGSKYHYSSTCSGMYNPSKITESQAQNSGYSKCSKCG